MTTIPLDKSAEFAQLQREYRHMELNRKSYADESYLVLRKQQATIAKLRKDNENLKLELGLETRSNVMKPSEMQEMSRQHQEADRLDRLITDETKQAAHLDEQILAHRHKVSDQRKSMGGVNAARENQAMVQKQIRILENRLDQALVKFNEALAKNKSLREAIDDLRRERVVFDNIYRKLERELHEKKKQMANVIELSNLSYEQRDNYQMEIAAIEQSNRKEQDDFEAQMLELGRLLDQELRLPAPGTSSQKSLLTAGLDTGALLGSTGASGASGGEASPLGRSAKRKSTRGTLNALSRDSKEKQELQIGEERVQNFEEAFNRIKAATGISAIDELVRMFIKNEDQNFSLFNYVNEQTNEIEKLSEQVQALQDEQAKYTQESGEDVTQHKQLVLELERRLEATEAQAVKLEAKCDTYQSVLDQLKKSIASTFSKTRCEERAVAGGDVVLADSSVTEANMLPYLAIIEEQCNSIIVDYVAVKARQNKHAAQAAASTAADQPPPVDQATQAAKASVLGLGPTTPMGQDLIHVNPPKLEDYSSSDEDDDDDDDARPLTRDELKAKTLNRMYRRVNHQQAASRKSRGAKK